MGHQSLDHSQWEYNESPNHEKLKHSHRIALKQYKKKHDQEDDRDNWNDWDD